MCDESHTWQRSDTYNVWRIAHDKDKGLLFHTKPRWKNFAKWKKLKNDSQTKKVSWVKLD
jgi:hypothetical protein